MSLGIKQCLGNPWEEFAKTREKGDKIKGYIKSITDFGIFIGLDGNIDGLVHLSDISWTEPGEQAVRLFTKGDEIETVILAIDAERERISLGLKQLENDPFMEFVSERDKGSIVKGTVKEVDAKQAILVLAEDVEASLKVGEISIDRVDDARNAVSLGEEIEVAIIAIDRKSRSIAVSKKAKAMAEEELAVREHREKSDEVQPTTIGDLIKKKMDGSEEESGKS
ncbi:MAG: hypothetical protein CMQ39_05765 [Gammaproteobacteria bacterium]|nr:hypothetical protein [Gammaproteobacteria bacterium]